MKTLNNIPISLTPEYVLKEQYRRKDKPAPPWMVAAAEESVVLSQKLVAPAAIYAEFPVQGVSDGQVTLVTNESGTAANRQLTLGPKADLLAPADRVMAAVYTLGSKLEKRAHELQASGEALLAYMLDSVGVLTLGAVGEVLQSKVEARAAELGWGVSPVLSPGSLVGWPLQGQQQLCALLPLEKIGVRLSDYYVLEPHKSVSMVIGLGAGYESHSVGSVCRYCSLSDTCWRRREDES